MWAHTKLSDLIRHDLAEVSIAGLGLLTAAPEICRRNSLGQRIENMMRARGMNDQREFRIQLMKEFLARDPCPALEPENSSSYLKETKVEELLSDIPLKDTVHGSKGLPGSKFWENDKAEPSDKESQPGQKFWEDEEAKTEPSERSKVPIGFPTNGNGQKSNPGDKFWEGV